MNSRIRCRRRGQSLILILLFLLALIGVCALTLDYGFVLIARKSMQSAVNTGALEGARNRDNAGRDDARELIRNVFDDNLDPSQNTTTIGAGPDHSLVRRDANDRTLFGDGNGIQSVLQNRDQYIYRPDPELNLANESHGDLVRGDFVSDGLVTFDHSESNDYSRDDFVQNETGNAFLARIRRTPERAGIANPLDRVNGVSSSGSGSPLLVGRLMPFLPNPQGASDIRRDGVSIRATAIAVNEPIVHVGSGAHPDVFHAIPFAYSPSDDQWYRLDEAVHDLGTIALFDPSDPDDKIDPSEIPAGYVAVVSEIVGQYRAVGFRLNMLGERKRNNASPRLQDAWHALSMLSTDIRDAVLNRHRELAEDEDAELTRLPVLVRSVR